MDNSRFYEGKYRLEFNDRELELLKRGLNKVIAQDKESVSIADGNAGTKVAAEALIYELDLLQKLKEARKNA